MRSKNTQATNGCANCGGQLQYNYTYDTNKCIYCGSVFKIEGAEQRYDEEPHQPTFVETPLSVTPDNIIQYNITYRGDEIYRERPSFKKAALWGLAFWVGWAFVSTAIKLTSMATNKGIPDNLFSSEPFGIYWFLRGMFFCGLIPYLRTRVFYKRY
ncbi:hypothetical protein ACFFGT_29775 [Mucilaginibacter angelicae]|uniref:DUF4178 domain-containing protein n=1 Tax=Mucilaginibacter angelicae TaxID=869718 RepID=A0ABV6LG47_9SPHI